MDGGSGGEGRRGETGRRGDDEGDRESGLDETRGDEARGRDRETMIGRERGRCRGHASLLRYYDVVATLLHCSCHIARAMLLIMAMIVAINCHVILQC